MSKTASNGLGAGLNSKAVLLFRADLLFSVEILTATLSSAWHGMNSIPRLEVMNQHTEAGQNPQSRLLRRNQEEVRGAENSVQGTGVGLDSSTGRKNKASAQLRELAI